MRRVLATFAALSLAAAALGQGAGSGVYWYGANNTWNGSGIGFATVAVWSEKDNKYQAKGLEINNDGSLKGTAWEELEEYYQEPELLFLVQAMQKAVEAQIMAQNIAKGLDNMVLPAKDWQGNTVSVKVGRADVVATGGNPVQTVASLALPAADQVTLQKDAQGKLSLHGASTAAASTMDWYMYPVPFFVPCLPGAKGQLQWLRYGGEDDSVFKRKTSADGAILTLAGWWDDASNRCNRTVADILTDPALDTDREKHYIMTRYTGGDGSPRFHYVPFGKQLATGSPVDGVSVTTNAADGATADGTVSLFNFATQKNYAIPYKYNDKLFWNEPDRWVDGESLEWRADKAGNYRWQVAGAADYAGRHSRHYFGTSNDKSAALGWHELPNVTTNYVAGDEVTISSNPSIPGRAAVEGEKLVGLKGWNYSYFGDPLFVANINGGVGYIPLPALTNLAACACTGKWESVVGWVGNNAALNKEGGLTLPGESMDKFLCGTLGYIYSTKPANLHFNNDDDKFEASFGPPTNWADGKSVALTADKKTLEVKGWSTDASCGEKLAAMLTDPALDADRKDHEILCRYKGKSGGIHYLPLGDVIKPQLGVDNASVVTNATLGATTDGTASLYGWAGAADGKVPVKRSGVLSWEDAGTPADDVTLATVDVSGDGGATSKAMAIKGFDSADVNSMPYKKEDGTLAWGTLACTTNMILAGAGINVTANGEGVITISAQALSETPSSSDSSETVSITVVTAVRYDQETHKFQQKSRTISFKGSAGSESDWTDVFEAVSHASEHEGETSE